MSIKGNIYYPHSWDSCINQKVSLLIYNENSNYHRDQDTPGCMSSLLPSSQPLLFPYFHPYSDEHVVSMSHEPGRGLKAGGTVAGGTKRVPALCLRGRRKPSLRRSHRWMSGPFVFRGALWDYYDHEGSRRQDKGHSQTHTTRCTQFQGILSHPEIHLEVWGTEISPLCWQNYMGNSQVIPGSLLQDDGVKTRCYWGELNVQGY